MHTGETQEIDNIIIGGGLAGLYCAWRLQQVQQDFLLLEAHNTSGGRIRAVSDSVRVDTGATWFWPHQSSIQMLVKRLELPVTTQYTDGDVLFQQPDGQIQTMHYQQGLSYKLQGGAAELIRELTNRIHHDSLHYQSVVNAVSKGKKGWLVSCQRGDTAVTYRCNNVFIALPPRMLLTHLTPENWLTNNAISHLASQQTWMSAQAKYVAIYNKPVWRELGQSGFAISHRGPLVEVHDASTNTQHYALFGFIGVPAIQRAGMDPQQLRLACRKQLCELFGLPEPEHDVIEDWAQNHFVASQQDLAESPRHSQVDITLLKSESNLTGCYFIASEYSQAEPGYMEGAIDAVNVALESLNKT